MMLCIANMVVVLKMKDITNPAAFGEKANFKFIACRGLLILADGQLNALTFLTKHTSLTVYQAKLAHVGLLQIECLVLVLLNSVMWKQTVRTEVVQYTNVTLQRLKGTFKRELSQRPVQLRRLVFDRKFHFVVTVPILMTFVVLVFGTMKGGGPVEPVPPRPLPVVLFDHVLQFFGPILVLVVFVPRCVVFLRELDFLTPQHESMFSWLPSGWFGGTLAVWLFISVVRWILFLLTHPFHDYFSDHIFLIMSMIAMLQMELGLGHVAHESNRPKGLFLVVCCWVLILLLLWDAWMTAMYYHTPRAVWTAFCVGVACFGTASVWWLQLLVQAANHKKDSHSAPLLQVYS